MKYYLINLRKSIADKPSDLMDQICLSYFRGPSLHEFCRKITFSAILAGREPKYRHYKKKAPPMHPFAKKLHDSYLAIKRMPIEMRRPIIKQILLNARGHFNFFFDPLTQNNIPYPNFKMELENRSVENLRICTPTIEKIPFFSKVQIAPEFKAFLHAYEKEGKKHLYVNLQHRNTRFPLRGNEAPRARAIEKLQEEFPKTLTVVTLSKDSDFYHQRKRYEPLNDAKSFKKAFFDQIFNDKHSAFYLPKNLKEDKNFRKKSRKLLDEIHQELFEGEKSLHKRKRCDFIEIFYTTFQELLIIETKADSYNASCKDSIDRGGGANALMYFYHNLKANKENSKELTKELTTLTFAPALLVKRRPIRKNRLDRLLSAMNHMLYTSGKIKNKPSQIKSISII